MKFIAIQTAFRVNQVSSPILTKLRTRCCERMRLCIAINRRGSKRYDHLVSGLRFIYAQHRVQS
jgi:hypothetical protein